MNRQINKEMEYHADMGTNDDINLCYVQWTLQQSVNQIKLILQANLKLFK